MSTLHNTRPNVKSNMVTGLNMTGHEVTLQNVTASDTGYYRCRAENGIGDSVSYTFYVDVIGRYIVVFDDCKY